MCIVIAKTSAAKAPTEEILRRCWNANPDGAGFAFVNTDKEISIRKGLMKIDDLLAALDPVLKVGSASYVIHFRIATHGIKDETNTHPFFAIKDKLAIVHNGILPYAALVKRGEGRSDTNAFTEDILSKLPEGWHKDPAWRHVIEEYMGPGNKIAALGPDGIKLLNKTGWTEDLENPGCFYSNAGFRGYHVSATTPYQGGRGYTRHYDGFGGDDGYSGGCNAGREPSATSKSLGEQKSFIPAATSDLKWTPEQRKTYLAVCNRMAYIKRRAGLSETSIETFKDWMKTGLVSPEHIEAGIDQLWENILEVPTSTLDDLQLLMGATSYKDMFKKCYDMKVTTEAQDETKKIEFPKTAKKQPSPGETLIPKIYDTEKLQPHRYNHTNASGFLNQICQIDISQGEAMDMKVPVARFALVTGVFKDYLEYTRIDFGTPGRLSWPLVESIQCALVLLKPDAEALRRLHGHRVHIDSVKGSALSGFLMAIDYIEKTFTLRLMNASTVTEPVSNISRLVGMEDGALVKALTFSAAK